MPSLLLRRVSFRNTSQTVSLCFFFLIFTLGGANSQFSLSDLIQECLYVFFSYYIELCTSFGRQSTIKFIVRTHSRLDCRSREYK